MNQIKFSLACCLFALSLNSYCQDNKDESEKKPEFKLGNLSATVFANFHSGISESVNDQSGFELNRVYLGYKQKINSNFSGEVKLDIGSPDDLSGGSLNKRFAYVKNAYLKYQKNNFAVSFGLISTTTFKTQEDFFGFRYVEKMFIDKYKFGTSADLGISFEYKFTDYLKADFSITNGEGYGSIQTDNIYRGALGVTFEPIKGWVTRIYTDAMVENEWQGVYSIFTGYTKKDLFAIGAEYNYQSNNKYVVDHNMYGYSIFGKWYFAKDFALFGRFDQLQSNNVNDGNNTPWNQSKDGSAIIGGIEYKPIKYLNIALNYQDWNPYEAGLDSKSFVYLNVQFAF